MKNSRRSESESDRSRCEPLSRGTCERNGVATKNHPLASRNRADRRREIENSTVAGVARDPGDRSNVDSPRTLWRLSSCMFGNGDGASRRRGRTPATLSRARNGPGTVRGDGRAERVRVYEPVTSFIYHLHRRSRRY